MHGSRRGERYLHFNSRPSARGDRPARRRAAVPRNFNSRPSARGDRVVATDPTKGIFQFTPLREGRQQSTIRRIFNTHEFQFTPLREGRRWRRFTLRRWCYFNSRPSARGDKDWSPPLARWINFNSRPSARGDQAVLSNVYAVLFQFTPLREGRLLRSCTCHLQSNFNSRPSARGDEEVGQSPIGVIISIHAPPRGATLSPSCQGVRSLISIHAPPRGATAWQSWRMSKHEFQFTPLREGRRSSASRPTRGIYFNSRPSARGDPWKDEGR